MLLHRRPIIIIKDHVRVPIVCVKRRPYDLVYLMDPIFVDETLDVDKVKYTEEDMEIISMWRKYNKYSAIYANYVSVPPIWSFKSLKASKYWLMFTRLRAMLKEANIALEEYLQAQFEEFKYLIDKGVYKAIPIRMLVSRMGIERYHKWLSKKKAMYWDSKIPTPLDILALLVKETFYFMEILLRRGFEISDVLDIGVNVMNGEIHPCAYYLLYGGDAYGKGWDWVDKNPIYKQELRSLSDEFLLKFEDVEYDPIVQSRNILSRKVAREDLLEDTLIRQY